MPAHTVRFGPFQLDLRAAELHHNGTKIKLPEQPFQILADLVEHPGEVVTREELRQRLWRADTFVDFEHGLNTAVKRLRDLMGDSAEQPQYIETVPRHGYRLMVPVEKPKPLTPPIPALQRWKIGLVALALLLAAAGTVVWRRQVLEFFRPVKIESLAVLPLENLSGNPEEGHFADDITGALTEELGKVRELRVASLQSVMSFQGTNKPVRQIAAELDVDAVLEGSVVRTGDKVRITVQLVQARPERYLWSASFERDLRDVVALREEVAHLIADKIRSGGPFWWSPARTPIKLPSALSIKRLTTSGLVELAAISPDGKYLAYTEDAGYKQSLWLQQMASGSRTALLPPAAAQYGAVRFSADGNYIYYTRKNVKEPTDLYQIAAIGGAPPHKLLANVPKEFAVSPDSRSFAYVRSGWPEKETVLAVGTAAGVPEKTIKTWPKSVLLRENLAWSPDGKLLAMVQVSTTSVSLVAVPVDGALETQIFRSKTWRDIYRPVWLSDGSGLIASAYDKAEQLWEFPYPTGQPRQITRFTTRYDQVNLTADSRALVAVEETNLSGIWVGPATEPDRVRRVTPPGSRTVGTIGLAWTPDGRMIYWSNDRDQSDFMMMNADGGNAQRLPLDSLKWFPNVCPDGHTLLFMAPDPITAEDVVMRAELDGGQPHAIKGTSAWGFIHCTPDGKWVVYSSGFGKKLQKVPIEGGKPIEMADRTCIPSTLSPDGRWIACHYLPEEGAPKLAIIPFAGGPPVKVLDLPSTVVCLRQPGHSNKGNN